MAVGQKSLQRANGVGKTKKTMIDKKVVLESSIIDVNIEDLIFKKEKPSNALLKSVETYGLICPVIAVKEGESLKVIDGAKRLSALLESGAKTVKAIIASGKAAELEKELKTFDAVTYVPLREPDKAEHKEVKDDIHEKKFEAIDGISTVLPIWLM